MIQVQRGDTNVQVNLPAPKKIRAKTDPAKILLIDTGFAQRHCETKGSDPAESEVTNDVRYQN